MASPRKTPALTAANHGGPIRSYEVAALAGVHRSTVSRALNPKTAHLVNESTRHRVLAAVEQLSYHTNAIAQSLKTRRSLTVGVLIPDLTNPLFPPIIRGIDDVLHDYAYSSLVGYSDEQAARARHYLERFQQRGVDGVIIATAKRSDPAVDSLTARNMPVVLVNRRTDDDAAASVTVDHRSGIDAAVVHLATLGHTRVACIAAPQDTSTGHARSVDFRDAVARVGLDGSPDLLVEARAVSRGEGQRLGIELLQQADPPTAIVAANDTMAVGCLDALRLLELRCPDDVSIVGFNDMPYADLLSPALTTVRFDHYAMGATAARILLNKMGVADATEADHVVLPSQLVVRASTSPAARAPLAGSPQAREEDRSSLSGRLESLERTMQQFISRLDTREP